MTRSIFMNGATKWIAIIVSIIIASVSLSVGIIRTSNRDKIAELMKRVGNNEVYIHSLKENNIKLDMQLEYLGKQMKDMNKKMDIVIERLK